MSALRRYLEPRLHQAWYGESRLGLLLRPLGWLTCMLASLRYRLYMAGWLRSERVSVPVIVIGNLAVGGTGKTPFVIWLADALRAQGIRAGIITRGYGGRSHLWPRHVTPASDPQDVGDEPVVLARRTGCMVMAGPDRVAAAHALLALDAVDVIISDDGLQHYRLARDLEIVMIDGGRGLGNGRCLPAGPLREPAARLAGIDLRVIKEPEADDHSGAIAMHTVLREAIPLRGGDARPLAAFAGKPAHALAGLANPHSFFAALRTAGLEVIEHPLPDHAEARAEDIEYTDDLPVLMTEKDMVKCIQLATERHWFVPLDVSLEPAAAERVLAAVTACIKPARDSGE